MKEYTCDECNNIFVRSYIISKPRNGVEKHKKYCSKQCRVNSRLKDRKEFTCIFCSIKFRIKSYKGNNNFCSNKCKGKWMEFNSKQLGLSERANNMRGYRSNNFWEKGLETRAKNGNLINWNKAEWKQYWRRCNDLTRKIRIIMLEDWDGYDYIDGEYIKDYLKLPNTHTNYPTLDHIKSKSQCFKEGISPEEATKPENLKWTKRINNSKKYNK